MNSLTLYGHPFSSYAWKALIALYETQTPFEFRMPDKRLAGRTWAAGENFTLADCAGAPDRD